MMSREKRPRGRGDLDTASIILNLQEFHPAIFDCNAYRSRTRVQAIFYEFFQGRGGSVNDLCWRLSSVWNSIHGRYDTSPAAILLITDSLSLIICFGSARASDEATWSAGIVNLGAKWRKPRVRHDVRGGATVRNSCFE